MNLWAAGSRGLASFAAGVLVLTACGASDTDVRAAGSAAAEFSAALAAGQGSAACRLLAEAAIEDVERGDEPCATAILQLPRSIGAGAGRAGLER